MGFHESSLTILCSDPRTSSLELGSDGCLIASPKEAMEESCADDMPDISLKVEKAKGDGEECS